jgi:uncharacterized damage-inducible protein DinB
MKKILLLVLLTVSAAPLAAQMANTAAPNTAVAATKAEWQDMAGYIARAADQMSEANYSFRPTPEVRTFGQLIGHLAGGQFLICAAALGEPPKYPENEFENKPTKAELTAAFKASTEYCNRAYAQSDAETTAMTKLFGSERTRLAALMRNTVHDGEHYGNIVTYMRMKGMVPPSSQPAPPAR